jgi:hypothetical protein
MGSVLRMHLQGKDAEIGAFANYFREQPHLDLKFQWTIRGYDGVNAEYIVHFDFKSELNSDF